MSDKIKTVQQWAKGSPSMAHVDPALASVISAGLALSMALGLPAALGTTPDVFAQVAFSAASFATLLRAWLWPKAPAAE